MWGAFFLRMLLCEARQSGDFNVQYANTFEELKSLGLTAATVLRNVTADQYNFATVSPDTRALSSTPVLLPERAGTHGADDLGA